MKLEKSTLGMQMGHGGGSVSFMKRRCAVLKCLVRLHILGELVAFELECPGRPAAKSVPGPHRDGTHRLVESIDHLLLLCWWHSPVRSVTSSCLSCGTNVRSARTLICARMTATFISLDTA